MNILIIDDHQIVAEGIKEILIQEIESISVNIANTCRDAILNHESEKIDFILLDYHMPETYGENALKLIKENFSKSSVIMISSEDSRAIILSTIQNGASGFISKASTRREMTSAFKYAIDGGVPLPKQALDSIGRPIPDTDLSRLTEREKQTLSLAVKGYRNDQIADELSMALGTVKAHLFSAYKKWGVSTRVEAVLMAAKRGLIDDIKTSTK